MSGLFYVFRCRFCGRWGVKEQRISITVGKYICKFCNHSIVIKPKNLVGLALMHHGPFGNPRDATKWCQELNKKGEKDVKKQ